MKRSLERSRGNSRARVLIGLALAVWLGVNLLTLSHYPTPSCDEGFYSMAGYRVTGTLLGAKPPILVADYYSQLLPYGRLNILGIGLVGRLAGVSLFSARLWGLLGWLVSIAVTYWTGKALFNRRAAVWATTLMAVAWLPLFYGHNGRPHIWVSAIGLLALGLLKRGIAKPNPGALVGLMLLPTAMLDFHLNSIHFLMANFIIASIVLIRRKRAGLIGWLIVGGIVGILLVIAARFIPDPGVVLQAGRSSDPLASLAIYTSPDATSRGQSLVKGLLTASSPLSNLADFFPWWYQNYLRLSRFEGILQASLFLVGLGSAFVSRNGNHRLLAAYYALTSLTFGLVNYHKWDNYSVLWFPMLTLMAAAGMAWLDGRALNWAQNSHPRLAGVKPGGAILGLLVVSYLLGDVYLVSKFWETGYEAISQQLAAIVPDGAHVVADEKWWFPLHRTAFVSEAHGLDHLQPVPPYLTDPEGAAAFIEQAVFGEYQAEYVLVDNLMSCAHVPNEGALALTEEVEERCELVKSFSPAHLQDFQLYHCSKGA